MNEYDVLDVFDWFPFEVSLAEGSDNIYIINDDQTLVAGKYETMFIMALEKLQEEREEQTKEIFKLQRQLYYFFTMEQSAAADKILQENTMEAIDEDD